MPSTIVRGATGQPGPAAYPSGITTSIFNELNFVIPDYISGLISKYGNDSYALAAEILGNSTVEKISTQTNTYSHFEKGRAFGSGLVSANVASGAAGSAVTVTFKAPQSYNNTAGTQSPFLNGQTIKIRSNGIKVTISNINRTTANAFTATLTPNSATDTVRSGTGTSLLANEGLETYGNQLAGESSDSQGTQQQKMYRYDNTATVLRASVKASDLAGMNKTQIDFGGSNYEPTLAVQTMNKNMLVSIEDAVIEGVPYSNTSSIGTIGVIPDVVARGSEVDYVAYNFAIGDFQNATNVLDSNGGPREYHMLQDLGQRQDINNLLFGVYRNGAISYGSVGGSAVEQAKYGFNGFSTDTFDFHFHRYKLFTAPAQFGYVPTIGDYRANFGLAVPQGSVVDSKDGSTRPHLQFVYQQNPDIPDGMKVYSWELGYTKGTKTTEASNKYEQICYVGSRTIAAEQFVIIKGLVA